MAAIFPNNAQNIPLQSVQNAANDGRNLNYDELARLIQVINGQTPRAAPPPSGLGNPGPLGLGAFAMTTFVLSVANAGVFVNAEAAAAVLPLALFYGGVAQFIAGLYEFRIANTFGATAFCSYGAFWVSFFLLDYVIAPGVSAGVRHQAIGLFLLGWTIFTFYMMFAAFRVSLALFSVFVLLFPTFVLLTVGAFTQTGIVTQVGGFFGCATAFCAWYCSAAVVVNNTYGKAVLPIGVYVKADIAGEKGYFGAHYWREFLPGGGRA